MFGVAGGANVPSFLFGRRITASSRCAVFARLFWSAEGPSFASYDSIGSVVQRQLPSPDQNANIHCMEMHASLRFFTLFHGGRASSAHCHGP
jgi:hypothetical protein